MSRAFINWINRKLLYNKRNRYIEEVKLGKHAFILEMQLVALDLFPEEDFDTLLDLSFDAFLKLSARDIDHKDEQYLARLDKVIQVVEHSEEKIKELSRFLMALSFASGVCGSKELSHVKDDIREKALSLDEEAEEIDNDGMFKKYIAESKAKLLARRELVNNKIRERVDREQPDFFESFKINSSQVISIIGIISAVIFSGGYYVSRKLTESWGGSVQHFFEVQDYASAAINLVSDSLVSTVLFLAFSIFLVKSTVEKQNVRVELKLPVEERKLPYSLVIFIVTSNVLMILTLLSGHYDSIIVELTLFIDYLIVGFSIVRILKLAEFFNRPHIAHNGLLALVVFFTHLDFQSNQVVREMNSDGYVARYQIKIAEKYSNSREFEFLMMNSNYVFLRETGNQKHVIVFPKTHLVEISPNPKFTD